MTKKYSKVIMILSMFLVIVCSLVICNIIHKRAVTISHLIMKEDGRISCQYRGNTRSFMEYVPSDFSCVKGVIIMLHGYGSSATFFSLETGFHEEACQRGYAVVYVDGVCNPQDVTSSPGWNSGIGSSSVDDIGFLKALARYMQDKYSVTEDDTYVVGFSNGAFMAYRVAIEAQDCFSGVASVAGMMPDRIWQERGKTSQMSVLQINGTKDDVVPMKLNHTDVYSKDPAIEDVLSYFADSMELEQEEIIELSPISSLTMQFSKNNPCQVWQVVIDGGHHGWPQESFTGFDTNQLILDFFDGGEAIH